MNINRLFNKLCRPIGIWLILLAMVLAAFSVPDPAGAAGSSKVAAGYSYSLALDPDGTVWAWGENTYGQLGGWNQY